MQHDHKLTYIDMHPQPIKQPRRKWLSVLIAALLFAACIGAPFALYFAFIMKP